MLDSFAILFLKLSLLGLGLKSCMISLTCTQVARALLNSWPPIQVNWVQEHVKVQWSWSRTSSYTLDYRGIGYHVYQLQILCNLEHWGNFEVQLSTSGGNIHCFDNMKCLPLDYCVTAHWMWQIFLLRYVGQIWSFLGLKILKSQIFFCDMWIKYAFTHLVNNRKLQLKHARKNLEDAKPPGTLGFK